MERFLLICLAGAAGTGCRYLVWLGASRALGTAWPWGTWLVNLAGCFLIAFVMQLAAQSEAFSPTLRLTLTTGFMGGLTTYSAFNYETTKLLQERAWGAAAANVGVTLVGCLVAGALGLLTARRFAG